MLYHNYPQQRTLVVAHSNQALNDVFSKTIQRDVPARYLLRLGMGQEDLDTDVDFSRTGMMLLPCVYVKLLEDVLPMRLWNEKRQSKQCTGCIDIFIDIFLIALCW